MVLIPKKLVNQAEIKLQKTRPQDILEIELRKKSQVFEFRWDDT